MHETATIETVAAARNRARLAIMVTPPNCGALLRCIIDTMASARKISGVVSLCSALFCSTARPDRFLSVALISVGTLSRPQAQPAARRVTIHTWQKVHRSIHVDSIGRRDGHAAT